MLEQEACLRLQAPEAGPDRALQTSPGKLNTFYAEVSEASGGFSLPAYVRSEFDAYMRCGLLQFGFSRLACSDKDCGYEHIVA